MKSGSVLALTVEEEQALLDSYHQDFSLCSTTACGFFRQFEPFIIRLSRTFARDISIQAELYQEGAIAAFHALASYSKALGIRLSDHVMNRIRWRMQNWRRRERRHSQSYDGFANPRIDALDAASSRNFGEREDEDRGDLASLEADSDCGSLLDTDRKVLADTVAGAMARLSDKQRTAVKIVCLDGGRPSELAEQLKVSRPRATQLVNSALARMRKELEPAWAA